MYKLVIVLLLYVTSSFVVSMYFYLINKKRYYLLQNILTSYLAVSLLPIFLSSISNDTLKSFFNNNEDTFYFTILTINSYCVVLSLAGYSIIKKVLESFNISISDLKNVKKEVNSVKEDHKELANNQYTISKIRIEKNSSYDAKLIINLLNCIKEVSIISKEELKKKFAEEDKQAEQALDLLVENALLTTSINRENKLTYMLTKLGRKYIKDSSEKK